MNYVRKLGFEEQPDYDFLRDLFKKVLTNIHEVDDGQFDWVLLNSGKGWEHSSVSKSLKVKQYSDNSKHSFYF